MSPRFFTPQRKVLKSKRLNKHVQIRENGIFSERRHSNGTPVRSNTIVATEKLKNYKRYDKTKSKNYNQSENNIPVQYLILK